MNTNYSCSNGYVSSLYVSSLYVSSLYVSSLYIQFTYYLYFLENLQSLDLLYNMN